MSVLSPEDRRFLKEFYRAVMDTPLAPDDPRYVPLYNANQFGVLDDDPVDLLQQTIDFTDDSVQLLAGFRGIGKSTELLRLKKNLEAVKIKVVLVDIEDYINMSTPIDISDFLMAMTGAFGVALEQDELLGKNGLEESVWQRFRSFLASIKVSKAALEITAKANSEINAPGIKKGAEVSAKLGLEGSLKEDHTFKKQVQDHLAGHIGGLVREVRKFFEECRKAFQKKYGDDVKIVLIVDSLEHIRGTFTNAKEVQASVENLFATRADELRIPGVHAVYTIPPFLRIRYPNLGSLYPVGAVQMFPAIKVKDKNDKIVSGRGMDALLHLIKQRHSEASRLLSDEQYRRIIAESGGHLRDLLRIVAEVIRRTKELPADATVVTRALDQMRTESLPIAEKDAVWLAKIAKTHEAKLDEQDNLVHLARFFDTGMVLSYRNGPEWYTISILYAARAAIIHRWVCR